MRGAGLEWYEQGDAWARVADDRPLPEAATAARMRSMVRDVRTLVRVDLSAESPLLTSAGTAAFTDWVAAFHRAGRALGDAARDGTLERGLRQVLAYHCIFHWNRLGLSARAQGILAGAARSAILEDQPAQEDAGVRRPGGRV